MDMVSYLECGHACVGWLLSVGRSNHSIFYSEMQWHKPFRSTIYTRWVCVCVWIFDINVFWLVEMYFDRKHGRMFISVDCRKAHKLANVKGGFISKWGNRKIDEKENFHFSAGIELSRSLSIWFVSGSGCLLCAMLSKRNHFSMGQKKTWKVCRFWNRDFLLFGLFDDDISIFWSIGAKLGFSEVCLKTESIKEKLDCSPTTNGQSLPKFSQNIRI